MIKPIQFASTQQLDSLHTTINLLNHRVDSLEKVSLKTTIGQTYFSNILSAQLGVFILIITIIFAFVGLVSWRALFIPLRRKETELKNLIAQLKSEQSQK